MNGNSLLACASALLLTQLAAACEKEKDQANDNSANKSGASRPVVTPEQLVPPKASDLAAYTEGLTGEGQLMVRFTTTEGIINCELFEKGAPLTVANFVGLARGLHPFKDNKGQVVKRPFYDGLIFHRVIPKFMIQGGDPRGTGQGGPGYQFATEVSGDLRHDRPGILSMANAGPNTNGSQFFITEEKQPRLDGGYNVFGACKEIDVVGKIARVDRAGERPRTDVVMEKVEIFRDNFANYETKPFTE